MTRFPLKERSTFQSAWDASREWVSGTCSRSWTEGSLICCASIVQVLRTLQFLLRTTIAIPALLAFFIFVAVPVAIVGRLFVPASDMFAVVAPLFYHTMSPIFGITCVVKGQENIEKAGKPCVILCAPHQSSMDVFIAASFVPSGTTAIGKKELAYIPFFNLFRGSLMADLTCRDLGS